MKTVKFNLKGKEQEVKMEVGMGATKNIGSDRYPYTVIGIENDGKTIIAQRDKATPTKDSDFYNTQQYTFDKDLTADIEVYTLRKNGKYIRKGKPMNHWWDGLKLGYRQMYQDPTF